MAHITKLGWFGHLRAEPNQYILHYKHGRLTQQGAGLSYWFNPLNAALAQVPVEDCEATFLLKERSRDLQEVSVQITLTYRFANPATSATRLNFTIGLQTGTWVEQPLEKLAAFWSQRAQEPTRRYLAGVPLTDAVAYGAAAIHEAISLALASDAEIGAMGLAVVGVQVVRVAPVADLEKALQTPTRESLQQKADEAIFARRALAVEKERAIKENELSTQVELAKRQEALIEQNGANRLRDVKLTAESEKQRITADVERQQLLADGNAKATELVAAANAKSAKLMADAKAEGDRMRVEVWQTASGKVLVGLALQELAGRIDKIEHLSITPDIFAAAFKNLLAENM
jgi:regulator of protease activity HflC (stomatin/prohibitin superfamily)